jgi:hypothetical protein
MVLAMIYAIMLFATTMMEIVIALLGVLVPGLLIPNVMLIVIILFATTTMEIVIVLLDVLLIF